MLLNIRGRIIGVNVRLAVHLAIGLTCLGVLTLALYVIAANTEVYIATLTVDDVMRLQQLEKQLEKPDVPMNPTRFLIQEGLIWVHSWIRDGLSDAKQLRIAYIRNQEVEKITVDLRNAKPGTLVELANGQIVKILALQRSSEILYSDGGRPESTLLMNLALRAKAVYHPGESGWNEKRREFFNKS